jgi:hypothetical protein
MAACCLWPQSTPCADRPLALCERHHSRRRHRRLAQLIWDSLALRPNSAMTCALNAAHSSQMKTHCASPGLRQPPSMRVRTSCFDLPQNEQDICSCVAVRDIWLLQYSAQQNHPSPLLNRFDTHAATETTRKKMTLTFLSSSLKGKSDSATMCRNRELKVLAHQWSTLGPTNGIWLDPKEWVTHESSTRSTLWSPECDHNR